MKRLFELKREIKKALVAFDDAHKEMIESCSHPIVMKRSGPYYPHYAYVCMNCGLHQDPTSCGYSYWFSSENILGTVDESKLPPFLWHVSRSDQYILAYPKRHSQDEIDLVVGRNPRGLLNQKDNYVIKTEDENIVDLPQED